MKPVDERAVPQIENFEEIYSITLSQTVHIELPNSLKFRRYAVRVTDTLGRRFFNGKL